MNRFLSRDVLKYIVLYLIIPCFRFNKCQKTNVILLLLRRNFRLSVLYCFMEKNSIRFLLQRYSEQVLCDSIEVVLRSQVFIFPFHHTLPIPYNLRAAVLFSVQCIDSHSAYCYYVGARVVVIGPWRLHYTCGFYHKAVLRVFKAAPFSYWSVSFKKCIGLACVSNQHKN